MSSNLGRTMEYTTKEDIISVSLYSINEEKKQGKKMISLHLFFPIESCRLISVKFTQEAKRNMLKVQPIHIVFFFPTMG